MVLVMSISTKIFNIRIRLMNGSMFTMVIQRHLHLHKFMLNGLILKIVCHMIRLIIILHQNFKFGLVKMKHLLVIMEELHMLISMLVMVHLLRATNLITHKISLNIMLDKLNSLMLNQKLNQDKLTKMF